MLQEEANWGSEEREEAKAYLSNSWDLEVSAAGTLCRCISVSDRFFIEFPGWVVCHLVYQIPSGVLLICPTKWQLSTFQIIMELLQLMQRCKRCEDELDLRTEKIVGCLLHIWVHLMGTPNLVYINQEFHLNCDISEEWGIPYLMIAGWLVSAKWIIVLACNVLGGGFEMAGQWYIKKNNQPEHFFTD